jgi:hypothetical protein
MKQEQLGDEIAAGRALRTPAHLILLRRQQQHTRRPVKFLGHNTRLQATLLERDSAAVWFFACDG